SGPSRGRWPRRSRRSAARAGTTPCCWHRCAWPEAAAAPGCSRPGRAPPGPRHDHPLAERLARAAIEEGGGFEARYVAAEAAHFQGRPGQAEQELAALAADAAG